MLAERLNYEDKVIEAQLAHAVPDALGRAYNRMQFLEQRRAMLQAGCLRPCAGKRRGGGFFRAAFPQADDNQHQEHEGAPFFSENSRGTGNRPRLADQSTGKANATLYKSTT
jgi:hypothetical protein